MQLKYDGQFCPSYLLIINRKRYSSPSSSSSALVLILSTTIFAISFAIILCVASGQFWSMFIAVLTVESISYQRPRLFSSTPEPTALIISSTASYFSSSILCSIIILIKFNAILIWVSSSLCSSVEIACVKLERKY